LIETCREVEPFFDDGDQHIDRDSDPDLSFDCVLRRAEEDFDTKMLLDLFEKQFDLPPAAIAIGDGDSRQREIVGEEHQPVVGSLNLTRRSGVSKS
jgi:hypothetical protein